MSSLIYQVQSEYGGSLSPFATLLIIKKLMKTNGFDKRIGFDLLSKSIVSHLANLGTYNIGDYLTERSIINRRFGGSYDRVFRKKYGSRTAKQYRDFPSKKLALKVRFQGKLPVYKKIVYPSRGKYKKKTVLSVEDDADLKNLRKTVEHNAAVEARMKADRDEGKRIKYHPLSDTKSVVKQAVASPLLSGSYTDVERIEV